MSITPKNPAFTPLDARTRQSRVWREARNRAAWRGQYLRRLALFFLLSPAPSG
ncbi:hypothetical protein HMPREF9080_00266 [Cardiobacterium valvarum F0432]|uniref:Uncharacterized protein n=1 Tax=Cardiobacterium valvarum F0432 TaxID=797473 RepID=G9ZBY9_9GAMM|nr:hypothetical protein HMPREF9080_00266 [Cardiobacterium valvarum F0432]